MLMQAVDKPWAHFSAGAHCFMTQVACCTGRVGLQTSPCLHQRQCRFRLLQAWQLR